MATRNKLSTISFKGQFFYIGIDVHKKHWVVTIRSNKLELKTFRMEPLPEALALYLSKNYPGGYYYSVYEAGFCGFWIDKELKKYGIMNIIINAPDVPTTNKEKVTKTDKVDSRKLARELENNNLVALYIPDKDMEDLRSLCRLRCTLSREMTRIKNRIKSHIYMTGIHFYENLEVSHWSHNFIRKLERLCNDTPKGNYLRLSLESLEYRRKLLADATKQLKNYCYKNEKHRRVIEMLVSIPGIGFLTAATLYTELVDINRFPSLDKMCSYIGLVPGSHESGDKNQNNSITTRKNCKLKYALIESAWIAIKKDPALLKSFSELSKRMKKTNAIIKIAKKLLNRVRYVWKYNTYYKPCNVTN
jgi:transposase